VFEIGEPVGFEFLLDVAVDVVEHFLNVFN
jgi:hypothetical protein